MARRPLETEQVYLDGGRRTTQLMRDSLGRTRPIFVMLSLADQESLHRLCTANRETLARASRAGCFYCCKIFAPSDVVDWVDGPQVETGSLDDGVTALCPHCGIDSVIPEVAGVAFSTELMQEMRAHWF